MRNIPRRIIRNSLLASMFLIFLASAIWWYTNDPLPRVIRIATAVEGSLYYNCGKILKKNLDKQLDRLYARKWLNLRRKPTVSVLPTKGSLASEKLLREGRAELAIMQAGAVDMEKLTAIAPLYPDIVHVVVRGDRNIKSIIDLKGKNVSLGSKETASRKHAEQILLHYGVNPDELKKTGRYFKQLLTDETLDAAIITTGIENPDLKEVLSSSEFQLISIQDSEALCCRHPFFSTYEISRGIYREGPPVPAKRIRTVATTAFLAAREGIPLLLVKELFPALYEHHMQFEIPAMISADEAQKWPLIPIHPASQKYFDPFEDIDVLGNIADSLVGVKEILFTIAAGIGLLLTYRHRKRENQKRAELQAHKALLDGFMERTMSVERGQMQATSSDELKKCHDELTRIKLEALEQLTHEGLRGDRLFSIFLMQCANVTRKIESKMFMAKAAETATPTVHLIQDQTTDIIPTLEKDKKIDLEP